MELVFILIILMATKVHRLGFGSFEFKGAREIFLLNGFEASQVFINGYPTGLKESGLLYLDPALKEIELQLVRQGQVFFVYKVLLCEKRTLICLPQEPVALRSVR